MLPDSSERRVSVCGEKRRVSRSDAGDAVDRHVEYQTSSRAEPQVSHSNRFGGQRSNRSINVWIPVHQGVGARSVLPPGLEY